MDCDNLRADLSAYLDGELDAADRARVEGHLDACPDCRRILEQWRTIAAAVAASAAAAGCGVSLPARVMAEIRETPDRRTPFPAWVTVPALRWAAVLAFVVGGIVAVHLLLGPPGGEVGDLARAPESLEDPVEGLAFGEGANEEPATHYYADLKDATEVLDPERLSLELQEGRFSARETALSGEAGEWFLRKEAFEVAEATDAGMDLSPEPVADLAAPALSSKSGATRSDWGEAAPGQPEGRAPSLAGTVVQRDATLMAEDATGLAGGPAKPDEARERYAGYVHGKGGVPARRGSEAGTTLDYQTKGGHPPGALQRPSAEPTAVQRGMAATSPHELAVQSTVAASETQTINGYAFAPRQTPDAPAAERVGDLAQPGEAAVLATVPDPRSDWGFAQAGGLGTGDSYRSVGRMRFVALDPTWAFNFSQTVAQSLDGDVVVNARVRSLQPTAPVVLAVARTEGEVMLPVSNVDRFLGELEMNNVRIVDMELPGDPLADDLAADGVFDEIDDFQAAGYEAAREEAGRAAASAGNRPEQRRLRARQAEVEAVQRFQIEIEGVR